MDVVQPTEQLVINILGQQTRISVAKDELSPAGMEASKDPGIGLSVGASSPCRVDVPIAPVGTGYIERM